MMNKNSKISLLLGGIGFVGRSVVEKYLKMGWHVLIPTREANINTAKEKLILHGFKKEKLKNFIENNQLMFLSKIDLCDQKWTIIQNWYREFEKLNIWPEKIIRIMNFVTDTSGQTKDILKRNIEVLPAIFAIVSNLKQTNKEIIFCNMGSVAEKRMERNLPPYELAKKIVREKIFQSGLCDYHFVAHYIKGRGEQKMKLAAPFLWNKLKISKKWLFGFKVSIVDVDDLADIIFHIIEMLQIHKILNEKPIEVNVTNGEMVFGEIVKNLLPESQRIISDSILPPFLENIFLKIYSLLTPIIKPKNQIARRLAYFAKLALMDKNKQEKVRLFKTAEEIKKMGRDTTNYTILKKQPMLIILKKQQPIIFVLKEKSDYELQQIVQKALF